jgi:hypothetical protein
MTRARFTIAQAEKALLEAESYHALQDAYARYRFPTGSAEDRYMLHLFELRSRQFADEHYRYARAI